jgi:Fic family protein
MKLKIISDILLDSYLESLPDNLQDGFLNLKDAELSTPNFSFYTSVASVYSSKIEGEAIEMDSYIKHKRDGIAYQPDYTKKTDDLYNAYLFAQNNRLTPLNVSKAQKLLSRHLVSETWQGRYRQQNMYVASEDGRIEYVAAIPGIVEKEMDKFFEDVQLLLKSKLTLEDVFYFASMIHLVFVKIHPWNDGNGRAARLVEKWFLAEKLGDKAWFFQSEKMYYRQMQNYFRNIRVIGLEYEQLDYKKSLPFLSMLPKSLENLKNM